MTCHKQETKTGNNFILADQQDTETLPAETTPPFLNYKNKYRMIFRIYRIKELKLLPKVKKVYLTLMQDDCI